MEEKDKEISRLSDDNKNLHQSLAQRPPVCISLFWEKKIYLGLVLLLHNNVILHIYDSWPVVNNFRSVITITQVCDILLLFLEAYINWNLIRLGCYDTFLMGLTAGVLIIFGLKLMFSLSETGCVKFKHFICRTADSGMPKFSSNKSFIYTVFIFEHLEGFC